MGVCDVPVISGVCDSAGEAAASLVTAPFDWLAEAMGNAAVWMIDGVWQVLDTTTFVDVAGSEFTDVYNILFGVAVVVMLGFFMLQVIGGMVRREPAALNRAALGMAKSILGSFVALTVLAAALEATDQLCIGIVHAAGTNMEEMGDRLALMVTGLKGISLAAPGAGVIITIFLAGLAVGACVLLWISLLVRKALLLVAIVFAPLAMAGSSWDHTRAWVSRWASFVIALILSKVVVVVIFLLATAQVSAPIEADLQSVSQPLAGAVLLLMAGFAPYLSYKAISFMGFDSYHAMSAEQETKHALNRPLPIPLRGGRGGAQPPKVLTAGDGPSSPGPGGRVAPAPSAAATGSASAPAVSGAATAGAGAATGGAVTAAGGVVAGTAAVANQVASTGPRLGAHLGAVADQQTDAANGSQPHRSLPLPHMADPALTTAAGKDG